MKDYSRGPSAFAETLTLFLIYMGVGELHIHGLYCFTVFQT